MKNYYINSIFQKFIDITYFLEFIEDHDELHEIYEDSLKELFGVKVPYKLTKEESKTLYGVRDQSLFIRFIKASLFNNVKIQYDNDFRVVMANWLIELGIDALKSNLNEDEFQERILYDKNTETAKLYSKIIANRYRAPSKENPCRHRIGYFDSGSGHEIHTRLWQK